MKSKIHIKKSREGLFTRKARAAGMTPAGYARKVLANPKRYSAATRKQANFARNARKWSR